MGSPLVNQRGRRTLVLHCVGGRCDYPLADGALHRRIVGTAPRAEIHIGAAVCRALPSATTAEARDVGEVASGPPGGLPSGSAHSGSGLEARSRASPRRGGTAVRPRLALERRGEPRRLPASVEYGREHHDRRTGSGSASPIRRPYPASGRHGDRLASGRAMGIRGRSTPLRYARHHRRVRPHR